MARESSMERDVTPYLVQILSERLLAALDPKLYKESVN